MFGNSNPAPKPEQTQNAALPRWRWQCSKVNERGAILWSCVFSFCLSVYGKLKKQLIHLWSCSLGHFLTVAQKISPPCIPRFFSDFTTGRNKKCPCFPFGKWEHKKVQVFWLPTHTEVIQKLSFKYNRIGDSKGKRQRREQGCFLCCLFYAKIQIAHYSSETLSLQYENDGKRIDRTKTIGGWIANN